MVEGGGFFPFVEGVLLDEDVAEDLEECGLEEVAVSLVVVVLGCGWGWG